MSSSYKFKIAFVVVQSAISKNSLPSLWVLGEVEIGEVKYFRADNPPFIGISSLFRILLFDNKLALL